ncbi:MAG: hypothetical protein JO119_19290, partial [Acidobacteria bacterium]|nr:hypothetical protein [Acidobacteriota bacterium]
MAIALVCCVNPGLWPATSVRDASDKTRSGTSSELQARFDHETNSVHKAKLFEKLSDEQLAEVRHASQSSDYNAIGTIMEKYRDNARAAVDALKKEHPNADHQLNGYKQLQIHIRRAIRDLKETVLLAPDEYKPPLRLVEHDLSLIDDELLQSLFPSPPHTGASPEAPPSANNTPSDPHSSAAPPTGSALEQNPGGNPRAAPADSAESNSNAGTSPNSTA